jgi:hypothetical protein
VSPPEPFTHLASTTKITDLWMVGPRLGVAWNSFMVYGTGGYAAARLDGSYSCADTGIPVLPGPGACSAVFGAVRNLDFGGTTWNDGWYLGAGISAPALNSWPSEAPRAILSWARSTGTSRSTASSRLCAILRTAGRPPIKTSSKTRAVTCSVLDLRSKQTDGGSWLRSHNLRLNRGVHSR